MQVALRNAAGTLLEKQIVRRRVKSPVSIFVPSPFVATPWKASLAIDYLPDADEKLELQVWANSNPARVTRLETGRNSRFEATLGKGSFAALDGLSARLVDLNSNRVIGTAAVTLFAK